MNKLDSPIALEVRAFLARTGLPQLRLATEAGISPVYVNRLVTGATKDVYSRTADALRGAMERLGSQPEPQKENEDEPAHA